MQLKLDSFYLFIVTMYFKCELKCYINKHLYICVLC